MKLLRKIRALFRKEKLDAEMAEEMRAHLEMQMVENLKCGMSAEQACYAAQRKFGNVGVIQETARDQRGFIWFEQLFQDLRFSLRSLRKAPGFTAIAVLTLALGIGVNTAMFGVMKTVLLWSVPYPRADELVRIKRNAPQSQNWMHSVPSFLDQQVQSTVFTQLAAFDWIDMNFAEPGQPAESLRGMMTTSGFFSVLGVAPALGRVFTSEEDLPRRHRVVVLSHGLWRSRFGADPAVLGRTLRINGESYEVIGVMPPGVEHPPLWGRVDLWRPMAWPEGMRQQGNRGNLSLQIVARRKPDVTPAQAQAELNIISARLARDFPENHAQRTLVAVPLAAAALDDMGRRVTWLIMGLAGCVLLIACGNLANLQLARALARSREHAIRAALGAGRGRLVRQLLTESVLVSCLGGALGLLFAVWSSEWLAQRITATIRTDVVVSLDLPVLVFAFLVSLLTGIVFGTAPAWVAAHADVNEALKQGGKTATSGRGQQRLRHTLVAAEIAVALALMAAGAVFVCGLARFADRDPGWRFEGLLTGHVTLPNFSYNTATKTLSFLQRMEEKLKTLPGVESVSISSALPIWDYASLQRIAIDGRPAPSGGQEPFASHAAVTAEFFSTLQIPLREGRAFTAADRVESPGVAIINESMARHFWPGESAIGKRIGGIDPANPQWKEIVGVVRDVQMAANLGRPSSLFQVYRPLPQAMRRAITFAVRAAAPDTLGSSVRRSIAELDPDLPVNELGTVRAATERLLASYRLAGSLLAGFAALGLALAALGIYGVVSGFVAQRTHEFGVRMALGAQARDILWHVLRLGLRLSVVGVALGLLGAFAISRALIAAIPGMSARDPAAMVATVLVVVVVALAACWWPARRATKVDPMVALRTE